MIDYSLLTQWEDAARTALGFFWKAGWAFVMGYAISAMIQAFVPKDRLTTLMGSFDFRSISLATAAGSISSSCSFAALAAARTLFAKGAHFAATIAFMFASTNLVIELGVLILIFLGWQFLVAELIGGLVLIALSALLVRLTLPEGMVDGARQKAEAETHVEEESFDWREKIRSRAGWAEVGENFFGEWKMVWKEILFGFTVAGFIAVLVPQEFWETIFLSGSSGDGNKGFLIVLQNALVAPFVAAATFIGSMGNIPLATVLQANGVLFAGIMGFIYSDLMVPPLVKVNAKYYGLGPALYIAGIMYVSIVITAVLLHYGFAFVGATPQGGSATQGGPSFAIDYTFYLNIASLAVVALMWRLKASAGDRDEGGHSHHHDHGGSSTIEAQTVVTAIAATALLGGGILMVLSAML
jgi:hypothetical protein